MKRTDEFNKLLADKLIIGAISAAIIILLAECVVPGPVPPVLVIIATAFFGVQKYYNKPGNTDKSEVSENTSETDTTSKTTPSNSNSNSDSVPPTESQK